MGEHFDDSLLQQTQLLNETIILSWLGGRRGRRNSSSTSSSRSKRCHSFENTLVYCVVAEEREPSSHKRNFARLNFIWSDNSSTIQARVTADAAALLGLI